MVFSNKCKILVVLMMALFFSNAFLCAEDASDRRDRLRRKAQQGQQAQKLAQSNVERDAARREKEALQTQLADLRERLLTQVGLPIGSDGSDAFDNKQLLEALQEANRRLDNAQRGAGGRLLIDGLGALAAGAVGAGATAFAMRGNRGSGDSGADVTVLRARVAGLERQVVALNAQHTALIERIRNAVPEEGNLRPDRDDANLENVVSGIVLAIGQLVASREQFREMYNVVALGFNHAEVGLLHLYKR